MEEAELFEVKRTEPRSGSKRFLDSFPRISFADSEKNEHTFS